VRRASLALSIALGLAAPACVTSSFVLTDARFANRAATSPTVFIDKLPPFPYFSIGVIEVQGPPAAELSEVIEEARLKGSEVGCDVVVDRSIHVITSMIPGAGPPIATNGYTPMPIIVPAVPPRHREFICGLRTNVAQAPAPGAAAPGAAAPATPPSATTPPASGAAIATGTTAPAPAPVAVPGPAPAAVPARAPVAPAPGAGLGPMGSPPVAP
jgi:hypothetical protein